MDETGDDERAQIAVRPDRLTAGDLLGEAWKHTVALGLVALVWVGLLTGFGGSSVGDFAVGALLTLGGQLVVLVALGHLLPTLLLRQVSWLWTTLTTFVLWLAWTIVAQVVSGSTEDWGWTIWGAIFVAVPVLALTILLRTVVRPLRPTLRLRTPLTADDAPA
ncbi:hypothetical protein KIN34_09570 [Cellulomonas sp. DKR-3]|uniref:Uncharacterized protein n=1 Tax=Cellulomonas fulva TaxID=2835530 RepID=A0ABS5TZE4_9CELL|nr:hypothetical protein [Cellulomonas fulva]MBT0994533.1 hypothetical protein [Cellulomonas fulva]